MANGPDELAVLVDTLADLRARGLDLEPVHFTVAGYEQLIAAAAATRQFASGVRA